MQITSHKYKVKREITSEETNFIISMRMSQEVCKTITVATNMTQLKLIKVAEHNINIFCNNVLQNGNAFFMHKSLNHHTCIVSTSTCFKLICIAIETPPWPHLTAKTFATATLEIDLTCIDAIKINSSTELRIMGPKFYTLSKTLSVLVLSLNQP